MNCNGNCEQGRRPCDCCGNSDDWWVARISLVGVIVIITLIILEVL